ncbi:MAG: UDP-glucose 4-epimerase GalE [Methylotenera sp.]|nr:UDP-glucose 4-epimerase GalE [Oligoflexia bacterium]
MAKVLVVGGAGYVGSACSAWLLDQGHRVWVLDDLSTGHRSALLGEGFTHARAGDSAAVRALFSREKFDCVMHFAARSLVGESVLKPQEYFENNVTQTALLLDEMIRAGIRRFIFSSTCAIFGNPGNQKISEHLPKAPMSPYGETKLNAEALLADCAKNQGLHAVALRYFNASGAEAQLRVGEKHDPETHLIPNVLKAVLEDRPVSVFGNDYPTPDGTCVRDYIYVSDLAAAHEAAMKRILARPAQDPKNGLFEVFNLGSESGYSVLEIIQTCEKVTGKKIKITHVERRPGDPPRLVADSALARRELGFKVRADSLNQIISTAWDWEQKKKDS